MKITAWLTLIKLSCAFFRECGFSSVTEPRLGDCSTRLPTLQKQRKPEKKKSNEKTPNLFSYPNFQNLSQFPLFSWVFGNTHRDETARDWITPAFPGNRKDEEGKSCVHCQNNSKAGMRAGGLQMRTVNPSDFVRQIFLYTSTTWHNESPLALPGQQHTWQYLLRLRCARPTSCLLTFDSVSSPCRLCQHLSLLYCLQQMGISQFCTLLPTKKIPVTDTELTIGKLHRNDAAIQLDNYKNRSDTKLEGTRDIHRAMYENIRYKEVSEKISTEIRNSTEMVLTSQNRSYWRGLWSFVRVACRKEPFSHTPYAINSDREILTWEVAR